MKRKKVWKNVQKIRNKRPKCTILEITMYNLYSLLRCTQPNHLYFWWNLVTINPKVSTNTLNWNYSNIMCVLITIQYLLHTCTLNSSRDLWSKRHAYLFLFTTPMTRKLNQQKNRLKHNQSQKRNNEKDSKMK